MKVNYFTIHKNKKAKKIKRFYTKISINKYGKIIPCY